MVKIKEGNNDLQAYVNLSMASNFDPDDCYEQIAKNFEQMSSEDFLRWQLESVAKNRTVDFINFQDQVVQLFQFSRGREISFTQEERDEIAHKFTGVLLSEKMLATELRLTRQNAERDLRDVRDAKGIFTRFLFREHWVDGEEDAKSSAKPRLYSSIVRLIDIAEKDLLKTINNWSTDGGKPKERNLQFWVESIAEIVIYELEIAKTKARLKDSSFCWRITNFRENLGASIGEVSIIDEYVLVFVSNFLETTGARRGIAGSSILRIMRNNNHIREKLKKLRS